MSSAGQQPRRTSTAAVQATGPIAAVAATPDENRSARDASRQPGRESGGARQRQSGPKRASAGRRRLADHRNWYQRWQIVVPVVLLALLLTGMAAGAWFINGQFDSLNQVSTPPPEVSGEHIGGNKDITIDTSAARENVEAAAQNDPGLADAPEGSVVILAMGVDARADEPIDVKVRADSLSVIFLDGDDGSCRMLSIPRDTRVLLPGYGYSKINAALSIGGIPYQQLVVEQLLGIEIDHYGLIDFAGAIMLVDALGRVIVDNDTSFAVNGIDFPEGRLALNGQEAVYYARYRGGPEGDFGRQERQQQVIQSLLAKGSSLDIVTAVPDLLSVVEGHVRTDLGPKEMIGLGQAFHSTCTAQTIETESLVGDIHDEYDDIMEEYLSFVHIDPYEIEQKVAWLQG